MPRNKYGVNWGQARGRLRNKFGVNPHRSGGMLGKNLGQAPEDPGLCLRLLRLTDLECMAGKTKLSL
jgi:hypothetical protein